MPLYTPDDPRFADFEAHFSWFETVLLAECGELIDEDETPAALNWLALLPPSLALEIETVECGLAWESPGGYRATIWDASGAEDLPWATFAADDFGVRLLPAYCLLAEDGTPEALDAILARAAAELPTRLAQGEFDRAGEPIPIPEWLRHPREKPLE